MHTVARLAARYATSAAPHMDQATGYALLPRDRVPELTAALSTCRLLFESKTGVTSGADEDKRKEKRAFLRNLLNNEDLRNLGRLCPQRLGTERRDRLPSRRAVFESC